MQRIEPKEYYLNDYQVLDYLVTHIDMKIDLTENPVKVKSRLLVKPNPEYKNIPTDLTLDGENMKLLGISLDGKTLREQDYVLTDKSITIKNVPTNEEFSIESETLLGENKDLFGLYQTEGVWLVKAESEGMRRVLFCKDRPDNLATYTTTIIADAKSPVLLSNGKLIETKELGHGVHSAKWEDKTPKASYLFAMVAGDLKRKATQFITKSGRPLPIEFYLPEDALSQCDYGMEILKKAIAFDEKSYGLECDLPAHMVTGVNKYASGASEPMGLNLFNTENLLATPDTKTDARYIRIAEVISHEYYHYWSGDRVTIRDWFNLTLKEGLTVFRAQEFLEDLFGVDLMRMNDIAALIHNGNKLAEEPPRIDSYKFVRSVYTSAAYAKGAEMFRMLKTMLGADIYYKGMHQYFKDNDGKAVTLETLISSLEKFSGQHLGQFILWFTQFGIPQVDITDEYNQESHTYTLKVKQFSSDKSKPYDPLPIPLKFGLIDKNGKEIVGNTTFIADKLESEFHLSNIASKPIPSLFRDFSAPVKYNYAYKNSDLLLLMQHDTNLSNRKEATYTFITNWIDDYCFLKNPQLTPEFFAIYRSLFQDKKMNPWVLASIVELPSEAELTTIIKNPNFDKIHEAREFIITSLAKTLVPEIKARMAEMNAGGDKSIPGMTYFDINEASKRRLKQTCMLFLSRIDPENIKRMAMDQFNASLTSNMNESMNALEVLGQIGGAELTTALDMFYKQWSNDTSTINNWFKLQASIPSVDSIAMARALLKHPAFDMTNPNKIYALFLTLGNNPIAFHAASGKGYHLIADVIIMLDKVNPGVAVRLVHLFDNWTNYDDKRKEMMHEQMERIIYEATSPNLLDGVKKTLKKQPKTSTPLLAWFNKDAVKKEVESKHAPGFRV